MSEKDISCYAGVHGIEENYEEFWGRGFEMAVLQTIKDGQSAVLISSSGKRDSKLAVASRPRPS